MLLMLTLPSSEHLSQLSRLALTSTTQSARKKIGRQHQQGRQLKLSYKRLFPKKSVQPLQFT